MMLGVHMSNAARVRRALADDAKRIFELHLAAVRTLCAPHYPPEIIEGRLRGREPAGYLPGIESGSIMDSSRKARETP
jgi:hypothetical protein